MTEPFVFYRTKRHLLLTLFSALMMTGASYLNFLDWQVGGRTFPLVVCFGFAVSAVLIWSNLFRRRTFGHVGPEGLFVRRPFREFYLKWDQLVSVNASGDAQAIMVAYRHPGETKERYAGFVAKAIGQEGVDALQAALRKYRPDLSDNPPQA